MHEFALADAVARAALRAARDAGMSRVERVTVKIGELQDIRADLFEFSLTEVLPGVDPALAGVVFEIVEEPVRFGCRACGAEFGREDAGDRTDSEAAEAIHLVPELSHAFLRCPQCGGPDFEILAGRGVTLERVEGAGGEGD
jgi:hydrogenase nickel incorporation protein HypA/HybF